MSARLQAVEAMIAATIADPATSYWLKSALRSATDRDVTDARADAFRLHYLLKALDEAIEADALERARESDALYQAALARIDAQAVRS